MGFPSLFPYETHIDIYISHPDGFAHFLPTRNPHGHSLILPRWVCPAHSHMKPIWIFTFITQMGSPSRFPYGMHMGIAYFTQIALPILYPYETHMDIYISRPDGFTHFVHMCNPYGHLLILPRWVCPAHSHMKPI